jgi:hypothetical protein
MMRRLEEGRLKKIKHPYILKREAEISVWDIRDTSLFLNDS